MNGLKERLTTEEIEIPLQCPCCMQFIGRDITIYIRDDGGVVCSRCYHAERIDEIASWNELSEWAVRLRDGWRWFRQRVSIRHAIDRRRQLQGYAWVFFKDCWKNPRAVQRRVAELRLLDRWQQRVMAGLDS